MTREEAVGWLNDIIQRSADCDKMLIDDERLEAITVARDVLEAMTPDAETGLMPCGCGGKVAVAKYPGFLDTPDLYQVDCFECSVGTKPTMSPERARSAWNKARGYTNTIQGQ